MVTASIYLFEGFPPVLWLKPDIVKDMSCPSVGIVVDILLDPEPEWLKVDVLKLVVSGKQLKLSQKSGIPSLSASIVSSPSQISSASHTPSLSASWEMALKYLP